MTHAVSPVDKRAFKRIDRKFIMRVSADPKSHAPVWTLVSTHNISASGALFTMDREVVEGERLWVKIYFLGRVVDCRGKVIRSAGGFQKPLVSVGVRFEELQDKDKEFIGNFCTHFKG